MSKHNYSKYSKQENVEAMPETMVDTVVEPVTEVVAEPSPVVETKAEVKTEVKPKTGTVTGCNKLNVRSEPRIDADVVAILDAKSEVQINAAKSNKEWVCVCTVTGIDGYCMRKFVNTNR